jgi:hypothetical protein
MLNLLIINWDLVNKTKFDHINQMITMCSFHCKQNIEYLNVVWLQQKIPKITQ